jgi:4-hydroxyacetophenone monooxygenase
MTAATESTSPARPAPPDPEELRANLRQADAGVLVAVLAQVTGDSSVIDSYAPKISHIPDPPERAGVTDPDTASALVDAIFDALTEPRHADAVPADDRDLFGRLLPIALGSEVDDEQVNLLLEQGGFQRSQPTLPRTVPIPGTVKIAIIGAGIAGISVALAAAAEGVCYEIFDRNEEVGGTWLTTTYPGIGVDTPSAYYSLSWDVNPNWSNYFPQGAEYQAYLVAVADKYQLRQHTRFGTEIDALWWDEHRSQWQIHWVDASGRRDVSYANVVITAAGYLNRPRWPDIKGRDTFAGKSIHSALWDPALDLTGKRSPSSGPAAPPCRSSTRVSTRSNTSRCSSVSRTGWHRVSGSPTRSPRIGATSGDTCRTTRIGIG